MRSLAKTLLSAAAAVLLNSCCTDPVDATTYFCLGEMSVEDELGLGNQYAPNIVAEYDGPYHDPEAYQYLNGLIMEMVTHSVRAKDFPWKFTILNSSTPNAFAVPGGHIYITRGLLAAMETEGQFISVMGHELGHVEHRHSHQQMGRQAIGSVVVGAIDTAESSLAGGATQGVGAQLGAIGTQLLLLRYDRGQETQSDLRGIYYAATMGYDPMEGKKTFEYFQKLEDEMGADEVEFLRTHPLNANRVAEIDAQVRTTHPELVDKPKDSFRPYKDKNTKFAVIAKRIAAVEPTYETYDKAMAALGEGLQKSDTSKVQTALSAMQDCASKVPNEPLFLTGVGLAQFALEDLGAAKASLSKAVQLDEGRGQSYKLFAPNYYLGLVLHDAKDFSGGLAALKKASALFPMNPAPLFFCGVCAEGMKQTSEASKYYQQVVELEGNPEGQYTKKANERLSALGVGASKSTAR
jgi:predicted Zn-dependent protease